MRLRRLHLNRYGGFADATLELPQPEGADVTVIWGPNEAGKSTAFSAWLDLLFGIPPRNPPAAWRFPRNELSVAADVETAKGTMHFHRQPTKRDNLRDADGSPVPEREVAALLHGLDRDSYRTRFSLDRAKLEKGGREIAQGNGDLGDLLFAGVAGLTGIQSALDATRDMADAFHRLGGRRTKTTGLGAGMAVLKEVEPALRSRLTPEVQARLDREVYEAEAVEADMREALSKARRAVACEEDAVALREIDMRVAEFNEALSTLPDCTWTPELAEAARAAQTETERADQDLTRAEATLKTAEGDLDQLAASPSDGVAAEVLKTLEEARIADASVLSRLGPDNDQDLARITARREAAAQAIFAERARFALGGPAEGVANRIEPFLRAASDAAAAASRAADTMRIAEAELESLPEPPSLGDVSELRRVLDTLDRLDLPKLRVDRDIKVEALERIGLVETASETLPDPAQLRRAITRHNENLSKFDRTQQAEREATAVLETRQRAAEAARAKDAGADATAVEAARQTRDATWRRHIKEMNAETAETFAEAMAQHDRLVAGLADAAPRAEALRLAEQALLEAKAAQEVRTAEREVAAEALAAEDLGPFALMLGLSQDALPESLVSRLDALRECSMAAPAARRAETALEEALADRARLFARLHDLLPDTDEPEMAARKKLREIEAAAEAKGRYDAAKQAAVKARQAAAESQEASEMAERDLEQERVVIGLGQFELSDLRALRALEDTEAKDASDARRQSALVQARETAEPYLKRLRDIGAPNADVIGWAQQRATSDQARAQARLSATNQRDIARSALQKAKTAASEATRMRDSTLLGQGGDGDPAHRVTQLSQAARLIRERDDTLREAKKHRSQTRPKDVVGCTCPSA